MLENQFKFNLRKIIVLIIIRLFSLDQRFQIWIFPKTFLISNQHFRSLIQTILILLRQPQLDRSYPVSSNQNSFFCPSYSHYQYQCPSHFISSFLCRSPSCYPCHSHSHCRFFSHYQLFDCFSSSSYYYYQSYLFLLSLIYD